MPLTFAKLGVCFQYPDNWTLDEEDARAGRQSVTVYSPGGAFWSVAIHPASADPVQLADAVADAMRQEYPEVEVEQIQEDLAGRESVGYDLNFYYLDLTNTAQVRCVQTAEATYTIFCQAEDREFDAIRAVFQAMTVSLLAGLDDVAR